MNDRRSFRLQLCFGLATIILSACSPAVQKTARPLVTDPPIRIVTPTPVGQNLSFNKDASASALTLTGMPSKALDGSMDTPWNSGASAPQWIQIDLKTYATITQAEMTIAQSPDGQTVHQVYAGVDPDSLTLIHEFNGSTRDGQTLEFTLDQPISGVRFVKILTTQSPSWVAWKEIKIFGLEDAAMPTPVPVKQIADRIYFNGQILTMEKDQPTAQAIAIQDDRILAVGGDQEILALQSDTTRLIDLQGLTLTPGFIDSHGHRIGDRNLYGDNTSVEDVFAKTLREGWTSIHELYVFNQRLDELAALDKQGRLPLRVSAYLAVGFDYNYNPWYQSTIYPPLYQFSPKLQIAGIKITLDREWGEQVFFDQAQLDQMVADATQNGWQVAIHSFSPKANEEALNAYAKVLKGKSNDQLRLRIEHTGVMTDDQVQRMGALGIIGSVQLINASLSPEDPSFKKYVPASEVQHSARWRDLINAGVYLIANTDDPWCCTDWRHNYKRPADEASVIQAIYQGVTRKNYFNIPPADWQIAQALTVGEALQMLTINGAYAAHQENVIGSLTPGKYADLVILSGNPLTTPIEEIPNIQVIETMVGGSVEYCAQEFTDICQP